MNRKKLSRRDFIGKTTAGLTIGAVSANITSLGLASCRRTGDKTNSFGKDSAEGFSAMVEKYLPEEEPYDYHNKLTTDPVHKPRRDPGAVPQDGEMLVPDNGWKIIWNPAASLILENAVIDFKDYLEKSQDVKAEIEGRRSLDDWQNIEKSIIVGTRSQIPGCGLTLKGPKDYEIITSADKILICGFDDRGAMFGLYNLEARMNLREAPILPQNLKTVRHSLYDSRLVMSWMGWMEWPDSVLSHLAHDGFDAIYASPMANPNGDRTTAENSTEFYARILYNIKKQDPARIRDLINRASRYGIKVYTPIIYQNLGTPENEAGLRKLVRDILKEFPDIKGYVLLTEGFWYKNWSGGHGTDDQVKEWAKGWAHAIGIVEEECHRVNPAIEILPWDYNIVNRRERVDLKCYVINQYPVKTIPLLTWENGKSFKIGEFEGKLNDYSISQTGPSEVAHAQIEAARKRGMKVYTNADTFLCGGQFQTLPYQPVPYQWYERYKALENYGIDGTLESWTSGYNPSIMTELRAWYCWSDSPSIGDLLGGIASRIFGKDNKDQVLKAWDYFSQAIRLVPDTGPTMGTSNATGNPLFLRTLPPTMTANFKYSWSDQRYNPWHYTIERLCFYPDFSNKNNRAENYARSVAGIQSAGDARILPVFLQYLGQSAGLMEEGLKLYRTAAHNSPANKRHIAVREVIIAEQMLRMMLSECAILEFEDLRMQLVSEKNKEAAATIIKRMEEIDREEIARTKLSLIAAGHDSRLGFQQECDYVFTPYSLNEKLRVLNENLEKYIPEEKSRFSL